MPSAWLGLEIGLSGLRANQRALDVTGHNVANANTKGYSRQAVRLTAQYPLDLPVASQPGQVGQGVRILPNTRYRDAYLDLQYRRQAASHAQEDKWVAIFDQLEAIFAEPSENSLQSHLTRFWDALQELSNRPSEADARAQVVESAKTLVLVIQSLDRQFADLVRSLDDELVARTQEVNELAAEVASLNEQILKVEVTGQTAHDLEDRRDVALDRLAELTGATWTVDEQNQVAVYVPSVAGGSHQLVRGFTADPLQVTLDTTTGLHTLSPASNPTASFGYAGGELGAVQAGRDQVVPRYWGYLETLVTRLVAEFNLQHQAGFRPDGSLGGDFFQAVYRAPGRLELQKLRVLVSPSEVAAAASTPVMEGDAGNAVQLVAVMDRAIITDPLTGTTPVGIDEFYRAFVGQLGIEGRQRRSAEETFRFQLEQADSLRKSESGVSLDEEMTRMIQYQQAYSAAARMITTVDELLDVLINRTGTVGR